MSLLEKMVDKNGLCVHCGQITNLWWYYDNKTGYCQCRDCYRKGIVKFNDKTVEMASKSNC